MFSIARTGVGSRKIIARLMKLLTRRSVLVAGDEGSGYLADGDADSEDARTHSRTHARTLRAAAGRSLQLSNCLRPARRPEGLHGARCHAVKRRVGARARSPLHMRTTASRLSIAAALHPVWVDGRYPAIALDRLPTERYPPLKCRQHRNFGASAGQLYQAVHGPAVCCGAAIARSFSPLQRLSNFSGGRRCRLLRRRHD